MPSVDKSLRDHDRGADFFYDAAEEVRKYISNGKGLWRDRDIDPGYWSEFGPDVEEEYCQCGGRSRSTDPKRNSFDMLCYSSWREKDDEEDNE